MASTCRDCDGKGRDKYSKCKECNGEGKFKSLSDSIWGTKPQECKACQGTGKEVCKKCNGLGTIG